MTVLPGLPQPRITKVACGACRKCCSGGQVIMLVDDDNPNDYDTYEMQPGIHALKRQANGDCIYLGKNGCTIWGRHPMVCRAFDCAGFVKRMDEGAFSGIGLPLENGVVQEGRRRLKAMEKNDDGNPKYLPVAAAKHVKTRCRNL